MFLGLIFDLKIGGNFMITSRTMLFLNNKTQISNNRNVGCSYLNRIRNDNPLSDVFDK